MLQTQQSDVFQCAVLCVYVCVGRNAGICDAFVCLMICMSHGRVPTNTLSQSCKSKSSLCADLRTAVCLFLKFIVNILKAKQMMQ